MSIAASATLNFHVRLRVKDMEARLRQQATT
jgi:hypothetical protein